MAEELFGGQDVGATPSYKEQAYRLIKEAILFNRFRVGAIYSQDDICKELGLNYDDLAKTFAPLCTKVQSIVTAESFDDLNK